MPDHRQRKVPSWEKLSGRCYMAVDWLTILAGITACVVVCSLSVDGALAVVVWSLVLSFYFLFYQRIAWVLYWSQDTLRLLRSRAIQREQAIDTSAPANPGGLPTFHILIAACEAADSIGAVIQALARQDYPKDQYHVWIITERSERLKTEKTRASLIDAARRQKPHLWDDPGLLRLYWQCWSEQATSLESWARDITSGRLRPFLGYTGACSLILADLLMLLHRRAKGDDDAGRKALGSLGLSDEEMTAIRDEVERIDYEARRIRADFGRVLGGDQLCQHMQIDAQLIRSAWRKRALRTIAESIRQRFCSGNATFSEPPVESFERVVHHAIGSTQEVVEESINKLPGIKLHLLDPLHRGFKPGALNVAYRTIKDRGMLDTDKDLFFVVIDSDSLMPTQALRTIAEEVRAAEEPQPILQMSSIPTANFFAGGWFSKFIAFADSIGAIGKWARSTRRRLKPDLHAGSGVVIPAALAKFINAKAGGPWDTSTLTEDARLIIGQFGTMNGASNMTGMVPVHLLEAVPAQQSFRDTYGSFWNQRRRWATGGYDECRYLWSAPSWLLQTRFDHRTVAWRSFAPSPRQRRFACLRQFRRLLLWVSDHFWWGIGGFIVLTHWWLISLAIGAPRGIVPWLALLLLLLAPLAFLLTSGRQLAWFAPGGISAKRLFMLYFQSFLAIWLYCAPVVAIQIACALGFRRVFTHWKPTKKPAYQESLTVSQEVPE